MTDRWSLRARDDDCNLRKSRTLCVRINAIDATPVRRDPCKRAEAWVWFSAADDSKLTTALSGTIEAR